MTFQNIGIVSDHAGFAFKKALLGEPLLLQSCKFKDLGPFSEERVDYPDYAEKLCQAIMNQDIQGGVAICGTGIGMVIACNKFPGIRASSVWNAQTAEMARAHNNCNVACFGSRLLTLSDVVASLKIWLSTPFDGGRHLARIQKIEMIENRLKKGVSQS